MTTTDAATTAAIKRKHNEMRAADLRRVEAILRAELAELNDRSTVCTACGLTHYEDWRDHQSADALRGALSRVEKVRAEREADAKGGA